MSVLKKAFVLFAFFFFLNVSPILADCQISSTVSTLDSNSSGFIITLTNNGPNQSSWIKIPLNFTNLANLVPQTIQEPGWTQDTGTLDTYIYSGGNLGVNETVHFDTSVDTIGATSGTVTWTWQYSENTNGVPASSCNIGFNVTGTATLPVISNTVISIGNKSATLNWNTDVATTGVVNFGLTSSYGSTLTTSSGSSHSASLTDLSPSTTYHYQISATSADGTSTTTDATFTTAAPDVTTTTTTTVTTTTTITVAPPPPPKDTISPTINVTTDFSKPFKSSPTIKGSSSDAGATNPGIGKIEYSLDGGKNWLPVDSIKGLNKTNTTFDFTPTALDDGNYSIKVRAKDIAGNIGTSKTELMIIDRLPPQVGSNLFTLGPLSLRPDSSNNYYSISGVPIHIVFSAVGGPTSIDLSYDTQTLSFQKNIESGLWSGIFSASSPGKYLLKAHSIDGAKNETDRNLGNLTILNPGKILDIDGKQIQGANIKVFIYNNSHKKFVIWDSEPFGQQNPQKTDNLGQYKLFLPPGKFYLEVTASGHRKLRSDIFQLALPTPINLDFKLEKAFFLGKWWAKTVNIPVPSPFLSTSPENSVIGKPLVDFDLSTPDFAFNNTTILGKPTIITFFSTWHPQTSDQLLALDAFKNNNPGVNVYGVAVQESTSKIDTFRKIGGYSSPLIADPDGILVLPLSIQTLPTHIFMDRKGIIKSVTSGFLNETGILNKVLN